MARTTEQIKQELCEAWMANATLQKAYGWEDGSTFDKAFSKVSIESLLLYIVSFGIWTLERLFDKHTADVEDYISRMKPHSLRWYVEKAKAFHYGEPLIDGTDKYAKADDADGVQMPVAFAACTESNATLYMKVAKDGPAPLTDDEYTAFVEYMREVKDAGVRVEVRSTTGDYLAMEMVIYYNPLLLTADGTSKANGNKPVEDAIKGYIEHLPFNGEFRKNELVDAIQAAEGVVMVELGSCDSGETYSDMHTFEGYTQPYSGYFQYNDEMISINYQPYNG